MRVPWAGLVLVGALAGCDDEVYRTCDEVTADWYGVECVMNMHCISCHSDPHANPPVVTILPDDVIQDLAEGTGRLVVPGDPAASKLYRVMSGQLNTADDAPGGPDFWGTMPWGAGEVLPTEVTDPIRDWIAAGAPAPFLDNDGGAK